MSNDDETLKRLIDATNSFCLVALDQVLGASNHKSGFAKAAERCNDIANHMIVAIGEVKSCMRIPFDPWLEIAAMNPWCVCR